MTAGSRRADALDAGAEILALQPLHRDEGHPVVDVVVEDANDVRAVEVRDGARLEREASGVIGVAHRLARHELHGAADAERQVHGEPDVSHAAASDFANEFESLGKDAAGVQCHRPPGVNTHAPCRLPELAYARALRANAPAVPPRAHLSWAEAMPDVRVRVVTAAQEDATVQAWGGRRPRSDARWSSWPAAAVRRPALARTSRISGPRTPALRASCPDSGGSSMDRLAGPRRCSSRRNPLLPDSLVQQPHCPSTFTQWVKVALHCCNGPSDAGTWQDETGPTWSAQNGPPPAPVPSEDSPPSPPFARSRGPSST